MALRMKNFNILGFTEKCDFWGRGEDVMKNQNIEGDCLGGLDKLPI